MPQFSLRIDEELAARVRTAAAAGGGSLNGWISAVLRAAVDPQYAGLEAERTRERLMRAGLLEPEDGQGGSPPDSERVARARRAAGTGTPLSQLVSDER